MEGKTHFSPTLFVQRSNIIRTAITTSLYRKQQEIEEEGKRIKDHGLKGNNADDDGASQSQVIWQVYCVLCTMNRMGVCVYVCISVPYRILECYVNMVELTEGKGNEGS